MPAQKERCAVVRPRRKGAARTGTTLEGRAGWQGPVWNHVDFKMASTLFAGQTMKPKITYKPSYYFALRSN